MGTSEKVNEASCYVTLIYNKLVDLDKDLKQCYLDLRNIQSEYKNDKIKDAIKYFTNEKRFWLEELKKCLDQLDY